MRAERFGPNGGAVAAFLDRLEALTDAELWGLEETVGAPEAEAADTRGLAESSDRLLAWYEAGHYADTGPRLKSDGTLRQEYPGQALVASFGRVRAAAAAVARALVVRDLLRTADFRALVTCWPENVDAWLEAREPARGETERE